MTSPASITLTSPRGTKLTFRDGIFIGNDFHASRAVQDSKITVFNPATGQELCKVTAGAKADVDAAVEAAEEALKTSWGLKSSPAERGALLFKWADLIEQNASELAELEAMDNGKPRWMAKDFDIADSIACLRYYAGLADKVSGKTIEMKDGDNFAFTRVEPIGVTGAIIPWNYPIQVSVRRGRPLGMQVGVLRSLCFPCMQMAAWKLGPALAAGNCLILKPAEQTPLSALKLAELAAEAGYPPGVLSVINGYGKDVGAAISDHPKIRKVAFTGSTVTGRKIMASSAHSNLKKVSSAVHEWVQLISD